MVEEIMKKIPSVRGNADNENMLKKRIEELKKRDEECTAILAKYEKTNYSMNLHEVAQLRDEKYNIAREIVECTNKIEECKNQRLLEEQKALEEFRKYLEELTEDELIFVEAIVNISGIFSYMYEMINPGIYDYKEGIFIREHNYNFYDAIKLFIEMRKEKKYVPRAEIAILLKKLGFNFANSGTRYIAFSIEDNLISPTKDNFFIDMAEFDDRSVSGVLMDVKKTLQEVDRTKANQELYNIIFKNGFDDNTAVIDIFNYVSQNLEMFTDVTKKRQSKRN